VSGCGPVERCAFEVHVGVQVDAGGGDGFVAEPERDHGGVDASFEEAHRGGVTQGVDGDVLAGESRAVRRSPGHVQGQALLDGVGRQCTSLGAGEEGLAGAGGSLAKVSLERGGRPAQILRSQSALGSRPDRWVITGPTAPVRSPAVHPDIHAYPRNDLTDVAINFNDCGAYRPPSLVTYERTQAADTRRRSIVPVPSQSSASIAWTCRT
jgi:hypothetical protein